MSSLQQKRPSISNWFSSLRRQPKNKKSSSLYGVDKQYQRSCIDLPTSTFYVGPKNNKNHFISSSTNSPLSTNSTDNLLDNERKPKANICARCCCTILPSKSRSLTPPSSPSPNTTSNTITPDSNTPTTCSPLRSPSINPFTSIANYNNTTPTASTTTTPISEAPPSPYDNVQPTITSCTVYETEMRKNVEMVRLESSDSAKTEASQTPSTPNTPPNPAFATHIIKKTTEFQRSLTTTTTQTLIVSRPVELILNEKGEIIGKRPKSLEKTTRSSSLGCVLDECSELNNSTLPTSPLNESSPLILDSTDIKFIDDSSTSQSENERNSQQSCTQDAPAEKESFYYTLPSKFKKTPRSQSVSTTSVGSPRNVKAGLMLNNNIGSLCDDCRIVIERNRNNRNIHYTNALITNRQIKDELCEVVSEMEALDVPEDCKHSNKDKQMSIGRKKFNMDPKKGIEYLVENRLLRHDPQDVAHFLYKGEGLNKTAIGDYLGENNDFNKDVLKAFVALHDFTNLILVQALRQFLWSFRLPGEAQKIDRMMECFAQRYCQLNPDIFTNTDTCYVLSFAIIMLNTSLHNPSVKDKPTVEQFISMNRGINNGGDLPRTLLESLYESIRTEPFKIPQDDGNDLMHTFFNPDKEGWLWKQGGRYKSWKRRWFILNDNCLYYFEYTTDKEPRGIIPLENISVREIHDRSKPNCFELFATGGADIIKACKTDSEGKVVEGKHTVYRMSAATEEEQQEWIKRLTQSISHNPFYDILVQRKKKALSKS
ncbi:cytohesin steppke [Cochliomyia hominivorax]